MTRQMSAPPHRRGVARGRPPQSRGLTPACVLAAALALGLNCAPGIRNTVPHPLTAQQLAELWVEPEDIASRDLFHGPGGPELLPREDERFEVTDEDTTGFSRGYDVKDTKGRTWKVKLGEEVQPEIVSSRLLWAIGYHQPPMYYMAAPRLDGATPEHEGQEARLRAEFGYDKDGDWSWHQNPFVGTRQLHGLLVANLIVNNWDIKPSQNRIYVMDDASARPARRYVVQDLGASLGMTGWPIGNRNDIVSFESQNLIRRVTPKRIEFDYGARHGELFRRISAADVAWTCRLLDRLSDDQLLDAFRAAHYAPELSQRYIKKLKAKIEEGLALDSPQEQPS
jgi:hypothetical protein